jgi:osmotically-inducible protein OsmY
MSSDLALRSALLEALQLNPVVGTTIGVAVQRGIATLHGRVASYAQKLAAERLAQAVPGVRAVANELEVDEAGATPSDAMIAEAAVNALTWYRAVPADVVHVAVRDGWVTLSGTVDRLSERGAAERAVRHLRGVRGVSNALTVAATPQRRPS